MTVSSFPVDLSVESVATPGARVYVSIPQNSNITTWPATSSAKLSFVLPPSVKKLPSSYIGFTAIDGTNTANTAYRAMHTGYLSPFSSVKLFETSNQNVLYSIEDVAPMSKLRNRTHYSISEAQTFSKNLPEDLAGTPTAVSIETIGGAGGLLQLTLNPATTATPTSGISLPGYAIPDAGNGVLQLACSQAVQNVLYGFASPGANANRLGVNYMIPLSDLGGLFSVDKYLPFAGETQLDVTLAPCNQSQLVDTHGGAANFGTMVSTASLATDITISNVRLLVDTANDTISNQMFARLKEGPITIPHPVVYQNIRNMPANQNPVSVQIAVSGFLGSKLRSCWSGVFHTATTGGNAYNLDNTTAVKWDSYRTYWNNKPLQNDNVDYKDAYLFQKEVLNGGLYQSGRDFKANPQIVDDFCGVPLWDKSLFSEDMGLPISGTTNTYTVNIYRTTGVATARNLHIYVEVQRDLVLTASGSSIQN